MKKISEYKPKNKSAYERLFRGSPTKNNKVIEDISNLITSIQSTIISNGTSLEYDITSSFNGYVKIGCSFDEFLEIKNNYKKFYIQKLIIIDSEFEKFTGKKLRGKKKTYIDFVCSNGNEILIGEIKEGISLDTKKSEIEINSIKDIELIMLKNNIKVKPLLVLWSCEDITMASIKSTEAKDYIICGIDFANKIMVDFNLIQEQRNINGENNLSFTINKMREIVKEYDKQT
jgi:hypothetical protein